MPLNAPKSERISQHHHESTQSEVHKSVAKPSAESARVVCRRGAVALQMSLRNFTETCAENCRKLRYPATMVSVGYHCGLSVIYPQFELAVRHLGINHYCSLSLMSNHFSCLCYFTFSLIGSHLQKFHPAKI